MSNAYWSFGAHIHAFPRDVALRLLDEEPCRHRCHCHEAEDAELFLTTLRQSFEALTTDERTDFARKWLDAELMYGDWTEETGLPPFFGPDDEVPRVEPSEDVLGQMTAGVDDLEALEWPWGTRPGR